MLCSHNSIGRRKMFHIARKPYCLHRTCPTCVICMSPLNWPCCMCSSRVCVRVEIVLSCWCVNDITIRTLHLLQWQRHAAWTHALHIRFSCVAVSCMWLYCCAFCVLVCVGHLCVFMNNTAHCICNYIALGNSWGDSPGDLPLLHAQLTHHIATHTLLWPRVLREAH